MIVSENFNFEMYKQIMFVYFMIFFSKEVNPIIYEDKWKYQEIFVFFKHVKKKTKLIFGKMKKRFFEIFKRVFFFGKIIGLA